MSSEMKCNSGGRNIEIARYTKNSHRDFWSHDSQKHDDLNRLIRTILQKAINFTVPVFFVISVNVSKYFF